jgi:ATP-binding cassette subfamily B protein
VTSQAEKQEAEPPDADAGGASFDPIAYYIQGRQRPKSLRSLPAVARSAITLAHRANPRLFSLCAAAQLLIAALLGLQVLLGKLALEAILTATQTNGAVVDVVPPLAALVAAGALASVATAFQAQGQRLLGEHVHRATLDSMLEVTTAVDLETFESSDFFDDLQRVRTNALVQPLTMSQGLIQAFGGIVASLGMAIAILAIEPVLLPILLLAALPLWYISRRTGRIEFAFNVGQTPGHRLRLYLVNVLAGRAEAKELRAFDLGAILRRRWRASFDTYVADLSRHVKRRLVLALGTAAATIVVTTGAFALLISFVLSGRIGLASAGAAVIAIRLLSSRIEQVFVGIGGLFESSLFLGDLHRFLERLPAATGEPDSGSAAVGPFAELALEDVRFAYPGTDAEALHGVSLRIRAGEVIALVGENGSGKTTLAKLVGALFTPTSGRMLWDGVDTRELDRRALRRHVGVIFQDFVRYQLTARENIGFGRAEAVDDLDGIRAAARQTGADPYLGRLPGGYETLLGKEFSGGYDLSMGQWQRIALARAFFRQSQFLILDEPTASLDARAEHELFEYVRELARGRSVLLISHRFSTVKSADRIYVLHRGELVEEGSHDELMALGGRYAELFDLQASAYR